MELSIGVQDRPGVGSNAFFVGSTTASRRIVQDVSATQVRSIDGQESR